MLHDLLLALSGIEGELFRFSAPFVTPLPWLHPAEVAGCESLIRALSVPLVALRRFTKSHKNQQILCREINALLHEYLDEVAALEHELVRTSKESLNFDVSLNAPVSAIGHRLHNYTILLPSLAEFVSVIENSSSEKSILEEVYARTLEGDPLCHSKYYNLLDQLYAEFIEKQLASYLSGTVEELQRNSFISDTSLQLLKQTRHAISLLPKPADKVMDQVMDLLSTLKRFPCDALRFDQAIFDAHQLVQSVLCTHLNQNCHLLDHLHALRQFFLLGNADLASTFLNELLKQRTASMENGIALSEYELNHVWRRAAFKINLPESELFERIRFRGVSTDQAKQSEYFSVRCFSKWPSNGTEEKDVFEMTYEFAESEKSLEWIVSEPNLRTYNALFVLLVSLRQAELQLEHTQMSHYRRASVLRQNMLTFLKTLYTYFQTDTIENAYRELRALIKQQEQPDSRSLRFPMGLDELHARFVDQIETRSFVKVQALMKVFRDILASCTALAKLLWKAQNGTVDDSELLRIEQAYNQHVGFLFRTFSTVSTLDSTSSLGHDGLEQFLTKLDYNRFYSNSESSSATTRQ